MSTFLKEFREFVVRGNVIDMAVGIIIGPALDKIVSALVTVLHGKSRTRTFTQGLSHIGRECGAKRRIVRFIHQPWT